MVLVLPLVLSALLVMVDLSRNPGQLAREFYTPHSVIIITSDADFAAFPGNGSEGNPYIIDGFDIDAAGFVNCVLIQGTSSHFVLSNCYLHGASAAGASLVDVSNGLVENVTSTSNRVGVNMARCSNSVLSSSNCSSNVDDGVFVAESHQVTTQSCDMFYNTWAARFLQWTNDSTITNCTIFNDFGTGILLSQVSNITVSANNITSRGAGIDCLLSEGNLIADNVIWDGGIHIDNSNGDTVFNNTFLGSDTALDLYNTENESLLNNTCVNGGGIYVEDYFAHASTNCSIEGNEIGYPPHQGVYIVRSHGNRVSNNSFYGTLWSGIQISSGDNNIVSNNSIHDCGSGILVFTSTGSRFEDNHCFNNSGVALEVQNSDRCSFERNLIESSERFGAYLLDSTNSTWNDNEFIACGLYLYGTIEPEWATHDIPTSNVVNGRPIYYLLDKVGPQVIPDPGEIILVRCSDMTIEDFNVSNGSVGLEFAYSSKIIVRNNTFADSLWGITSNNADNCTIANNTCLRCSSDGVDVWRSYDVAVENNTASWCSVCLSVDGTNNTVSFNQCSDSDYGLTLSGTLSKSSNNSFLRCGTGTYVYGTFLALAGNDYSGDSWLGADIWDSSNVTVSDSTFIDVPIGVELAESRNCTASGNEFVNSGFFIAYSGNPLFANSHTIDSTNTVNGLPVFYAKNTNGVSVPAGVGQAIVANCQNVIAHDMELAHTTVGLQLEFCTNVIAYNLNCSSDVFGMYLGGCDGGWFYDNNCSENSINGMFFAASDSNVVRNNLFYLNGEYGIMMSNDAGLSSMNLIYNNTFAYNNGATDLFSVNHTQVYDMSSSNSWNSTGSPHGYGNYWADWTGPDGDGDGIVDVPYNISSTAKDLYPLTAPTVPFVVIPEFPMLFAVVPMVVLGLVMKRILSRGRRRGP